MSGERHPALSVPALAAIIKDLSVTQLLELRSLLAEGGDPTGVGALIPPNLPLKEGGAEVEFKDWPADYFETME